MSDFMNSPAAQALAKKVQARQLDDSLADVLLRLWQQPRPSVREVCAMQLVLERQLQDTDPFLVTWWRSFVAFVADSHVFAQREAQPWDGRIDDDDGDARKYVLAIIEASFTLVNGKVVCIDAWSWLCASRVLAQEPSIEPLLRRALLRQGAPTVLEATILWLRPGSVIVDTPAAKR